jgi:hypothetical protein
MQPLREPQTSSLMRYQLAGSTVTLMIAVSIRNEYDLAEKLNLPRQSPDHYP